MRRPSGLELDLREDLEVGPVGLRQQEEALDDALDATQLIEGDVDLARVRSASSQHLEVAARDRDRRA